MPANAGCVRLLRESEEMMSELKLCKDCAYFFRASYGQPAMCGFINPETSSEKDPVYGYQIQTESIKPVDRRKTGSCGMDAKFFEQKKPDSDPYAYVLRKDEPEAKHDPKPWWRFWK